MKRDNARQEQSPVEKPSSKRASEPTAAPLAAGPLKETEAQTSPGKFRVHASIPAGWQGLANPQLSLAFKRMVAVRIAKRQGNHAFQRALLPLMRKADTRSQDGKPSQAEELKKPAQAADLIASQYPHLAKVISGQEVKQVQKYLNAVFRNAELAKKEEAIWKRQPRADIYTPSGRYEPLVAWYSVDRAAYERLERQTIQLPWSSQIIHVDMSGLISPDILAPQPWNVKDEAIFRYALYTKLCSEPARLVIQDGLEPKPLFRFFWGPKGWEIPNEGGLVRFDHLMKIQELNDLYYKSVARGPTFQILWKAYEKMNSAIESGEFLRDLLEDIAYDQPYVQYWVEILGRTKLPSVNLFWHARDLTFQSADLLIAGKVELAGLYLMEAGKAYVKAMTTLRTYQHRSMMGASRAVSVLKATEVVGTVAATIATGGLAAEAGAGLTGVALASSEGAGVSAALQNETEQASSINLGMRKGYDVREIAAKGGAEAITAFVGTITGGRIAKLFEETLGPILTKLSLSSAWQAVLNDAAAGSLSAPVAAATHIVTERIISGEETPTSAQEVWELIKEETVKGGIIHVALGILMRKYGVGATSGKPGEEGGTPVRMGEEGQPGARPAEDAAPAVAPAPGPAALKKLVWTPEEMKRFSVDYRMKGFEGQEGFAGRTEGTTYLVRVGKAGKGEGGGPWGDHLFKDLDEAIRYAEYVARTQPAEVARAGRAIPHQWKTGDVSRFEALKIMEVPNDTAYWQGTVASQPEAAKVYARVQQGMSPEDLLKAAEIAKKLPGGGPQVLIDPAVRLKSVDWEAPLQPGGGSTR